MDKFEREKHNRRERVYKYPRINLWAETQVTKAKYRKDREREVLELRCLNLYRDFFRNPANSEYVSKPIRPKEFSDISAELFNELRIGSKVFDLIEYDSDRYKEFMTPRQLLFWGELNELNYQKYRADVEAIKEEEMKSKNRSMIEALKRRRFEEN
jgi:hypothetical protein